MVSQPSPKDVFGQRILSLYRNASDQTVEAGLTLGLSKNDAAGVSACVQMLGVLATLKVCGFHDADSRREQLLKIAASIEAQAPDQWGEVDA